MYNFPLKLQSKDGRIVSIMAQGFINCGSASIDTLIKASTKSTENGSENDIHLIALPNISSITLNKIKDWVNSHLNSPIYDSNTASYILSSEESKFFRQMEPTELVDLIHGAEYLDIKNLIDKASILLASLCEEETSFFSPI